MRRALASVLALVAAVPAAGAAPAERGKLSSFRLATGRIGCAYSTSPSAHLRCDVLGGIRPLPPKPRSCEFDWGIGIGLSRTGPSRLLCVSDTAYDQLARILRVGTSWKAGAFTCTAQPEGLTCWNASARGFLVSPRKTTRF